MNTQPNTPASRNEEARKALQDVYMALAEVPCNCSARRREEGEHLSGCHLFDLCLAIDALAAPGAARETSAHRDFNWEAYSAGREDERRTLRPISSATEDDHSPNCDIFAGGRTCNCGAAPGSAIDAREQEAIPAGVLTAIRNEGLTLCKTIRGYVLMRLGEIEAQSSSREEAPAASAQVSSELLLGWKRYEKARKLSPFQWNRLHIRNLAGENFDEMIDSLPEPSTPVPSPSEALSPATVAQPKCLTCNGHGMVGGLMSGGGGYDSLECPECKGSGATVAQPVDVRILREMADRWESQAAEETATRRVDGHCMAAALRGCAHGLRIAIAQLAQPCASQGCAEPQTAGDEAFRLKKLAGQMVAPVGRGYAEGWKAGYDAALSTAKSVEHGATDGGSNE